MDFMALKGQENKKNIIVMSSFFKDLLLFTNGVMIVFINVSMRFVTWTSLLPVNVNI